MERKGIIAMSVKELKRLGVIEEAIKKQILVSGKVEIVDYASLPRSERKSKRVFDNR